MRKWTFTTIALVALLEISARYDTSSRPATHANGQPTAPAVAGEVWNLDNDARLWDVPHCELAARPVECSTSGIKYDPPANESILTPSGDPLAFRAALWNGPPYPGVMWRRELSEAPDATWSDAFELSFEFYYRPPSTFNNDAEPSRVQAIEFSFAIWRHDPRDGLYRTYDWELQWLNVLARRDLEPMWRLWAGEASGEWLPTSANPAPARMAPEQWHHVVLRGKVTEEASIPQGRGVHYVVYGVNDVWYPVHRTYTPVIRGNVNGTDSAQVHVQLDGPADLATTGGYEVLVDDMTLRYYSADPWPETCPTSRGDAARLFGGSAHWWSRLEEPPNGWTYNLNGDRTAPPIRDGYIPPGMRADWWDGEDEHHGVPGVDRILYATTATLWCPLPTASSTPRTTPTPSETPTGKQTPTQLPSKVPSATQPAASATIALTGTPATTPTPSASHTRIATSTPKATLAPPPPTGYPATAPATPFPTDGLTSYLPLVARWAFPTSALPAVSPDRHRHSTAQ